MPRKRKQTEVSSKNRIGTFRLITAWMQVEKVYDANTIQGTISYRRWWLGKAHEGATVRLNGITCPELHITQAKNPDEFAIEVTHYIKQRIQSKQVKVVLARKRSSKELIRESYSEGSGPRLLAFIHPTVFGIKRPESLNVQLVRKGWARRQPKPEWMTKEYHRQLLRAERRAKRRRIGQWTNYEGDTEPTRWNFWIGFLFGILTGFAACLWWLRF